MITENWTPIRKTLPREGQVVNTMTESGVVQPLVLKGKLWFLPDMSMYVYYEPMFWKPK